MMAMIRHFGAEMFDLEQYRHGHFSDYL